MRRILGISVLLMVALISPLFALNAVVKEVSGKVQLLAPGASWKDASIGSFITPGTVISTGFGSTAVLDLGTSQLQVKQLTRMRLDELLRTQTTATTALFLTVGHVRADVDTSLGVTQKFTLTSPVSTAAVRGTIFDFGPFSVTVERGVVRFTNEYDIGRDVAQGQSSEWNGAYVPGSAEAFLQARATTQVIEEKGSESKENSVTITVNVGS